MSKVTLIHRRWKWGADSGLTLKPGLALTSGCKHLQENFRVVQNWVIQVVYNFLPAAKQVLTGPLP